MSRNGKGYTPRYAPRRGEESKRHSGCSSILAKDWLPDEESHVVLAACKEYQFAMERRVDGVEVGIFTHSLLRLLRSGFCTAETTYDDLLRGFDWSPYQTPVVAGKYRDSRLWYQHPIQILPQRFIRGSNHSCFYLATFVFVCLSFFSLLYM